MLLPFEQSIETLDDLRWKMDKATSLCPWHEGMPEWRVTWWRGKEDELCWDASGCGCFAVSIEEEIAARIRRGYKGKSAEKAKPEEKPPHPAGNGHEKKKQPKRKIEGHTAAAIVKMVLPDAKWAVPGLLCEGLNILAGGQKLGKSWMALAICIAIAVGGRALGKIEVIQGDVLYLALEDTLRRLQDRLLKLMQGEQAPERLTIFTEWPRLDDNGLKWLRDWVVAHPSARLIVIDTLKKVRPPRAKNGNTYDEDYDFMGELKALADEFGIAVLVLHHVRKAVAEDIFDTVSGTIGLTGAADATLVLTRSRGKKEGLLHLTGRDVEEMADEDAMALEWSAETGCWTLIGTAADINRSDERKEIIQLMEIAERPLSPKEIADMTNKNLSTVGVLLMKMVQSGEAEKAGYGKYTLAPPMP